MSLLARLAPHLPYVRRYARALTGDQTTGDHYVRVALEALAAGERSLDVNLSPRVALYRVFHDRSRAKRPRKMGGEAQKTRGGKGSSCRLSLVVDCH